MCIPVGTHTSGGFIIGDFESGTLFWQFVLSGVHHLGACCDPTGPAISTLGPTILPGRGRCDNSPAVHATATSTLQTRLVTINERARQRQTTRRSGERRPHINNMRLSSLNYTTPTNTSSALANGKTTTRGDHKPKQAPPSYGSASRTGTTLASSTKHAHGNTTASETKALQPRVQRGREGATLGILSPLGSRYQFQK